MNVAKLSLFLLVVLSCAFEHVTSHPNRQSSDSESEIDDFRGFPIGRFPLSDESGGFTDEYDMNDLDFDEDDEDEDYEYHSIINSKRTPNSVASAAYRNRAGYFLIEGPGHTVTGTKDISTCNSNGIFRYGKKKGVPFVKNAASGYFLAIDDAGTVYMSPNPTPDTAIRHMMDLRDITQIYLYRKAPTGRFYLDISPESNAVRGQNVSDTSKFKVRLGKTC